MLHVNKLPKKRLIVFEQDVYRGKVINILDDQWTVRSLKVSDAGVGFKVPEFYLHIALTQVNV